MKIIIDIPKEIYERCRKYELHCGEAEALESAVANGTLLSKGHGRIVDIGPYEGKVIVSRIYCGINKPVEVAELDTIIEAESEE